MLPENFELDTLTNYFKVSTMYFYSIHVFYILFSFLFKLTYLS